MPGRYASALFTLAQDQGAVDSVSENLERFATLVNLNNDMARLVKSPVFSSAEQINALNAIFERIGVTGLAANFIRLVAQKRRLFAISRMIDGFNNLKDASRGVAHAEVTVAQPLSEAHLAALKAELAKITGGKSVNVNVKLDPSIIGGLIVKLGSRMVDGSLRTRLNTISTRMKEVG